MTLAPSLRALVDFRSFHRTRRNRANVVMQSSVVEGSLPASFATDILEFSLTKFTELLAASTDEHVGTFDSVFVRLQRTKTTLRMTVVQGQRYFPNAHFSKSPVERNNPNSARCSSNVTSCSTM